VPDPSEGLFAGGTLPHGALGTPEREDQVGEATEETPRQRADWMKITPIVISLVALCLSTISLWNGYLSPADISIGVGAPMLVPNPYNASPHKIGVGLAVSFANSGARGEFVDDLALEVESLDGKTSMIFFPHVIYDGIAFSKERGSGKSGIDAMKSTFTPIYVPPRGQINQDMLFGPWGKNELATLDAGNYKWKLYLRLRSDVEYNPKHVLVREVRETTRVQVAGGMTKILTPYQERDEFLKARGQQSGLNDGTIR